MKIFERFFTNFFRNKNITNDRLNSYSIDSLSKLNSNNPGGIWNAIIALTTPLLLAFQTKIETKTEKIGGRISKTVTVDDYQDEFVDLIQSAEGVVKGTYPKGSSVYREFFINKLSYYTQPTRDKIIEHVDHFITVFTAHDELGTTNLDALTAFKAKWTPARSGQVTDKGAVKTVTEEVSAERTALETQLFSNVLTVANKYIDQPEMIVVYFDPSLLYPETHEMFIPGVVNQLAFKALQTKNTRIEGLVGATLRIINSGTTRLQFFTKSNTTRPTPGAQSLIVAPGGDVTTTQEAISGSATDKYLFVKNMDAAAGEGSVEITGSIKVI
jgi:hypothetical protein